MASTTISISHLKWDTLPVVIKMKKNVTNFKNLLMFYYVKSFDQYDIATHHIATTVLLDSYDIYRSSGFSEFIESFSKKVTYIQKIYRGYKCRKTFRNMYGEPMIIDE